MARILICSPTGEAQQTGNWHTARRYAELLESVGHSCSVALTEASPGRPAAEARSLLTEQRPDAVLVLHLARGHDWVETAHSQGIPVGVVVTGTDLYRDLGPGGSPPATERALASLRLAQRVVTLQRCAAEELTARFPWLEGRLRVIPQTVAPREGLRASAYEGLEDDGHWSRPLRMMVCGHIRPEKDPLTALWATVLLAEDYPDAAEAGLIQLQHIGGSLADDLAEEVQGMAALRPRLIRCAGQMRQEEIRLAMAGHHLLIQPSLMEGGALVVSEAVAVGLPVLASDIAGHRGLLGDHYPGLYPVGNEQALSDLMSRFVRSRSYRQELQQALLEAAPALTSPELERAQLKAVVASLLSASASPPQA